MSSGALALPSVCRRCQLHAAITQTGPFRTHIAQRCKAFSTHRPRFQEAVQAATRKHGGGGGGFVWRRIALSEKQNTPIILENVPKAKSELRTNVQRSKEAKATAIDTGSDGVSSAKQIERDISGRHLVPAEADVNASLDELRVKATRQSTVISAAAFKDRLQELLQSYTVHQLNRYLVRSIRSTSHKINRGFERQLTHGINELHMSQWRAGRTPLTQRPVKEVRQKGPSPKMRIAEKILRLVWSITVESEENESGELELQLKPWQMSFLFDLSSDGTRYLEGLVEPQTLIQNTNIQPYRPDNIMRITGRRQAAEEIARQLNLALLTVHRHVWDLQPLAAFSGSSGVVPTAIYKNEDISYVSKLTETTIVYEDNNVLAIYCRNSPGIYNARRLLLALLDQTHISFDGMASIEHGTPGASSALPVGNPQVGVHRRYHGLELSRTVRPLDNRHGHQNGDSSHPQANMDETAIAVARQLDLVPPPRQIAAVAKQGSSYWREQVLGHSSRWKVRLCTLLHPKSEDSLAAKDSSGSTPTNTIVQHAIPGLETLLPYFEEPRGSQASETAEKAPHAKSDYVDRTLPYIIAHLKPSAYSGVALPRLEMRFQLYPKSDAETHELTLTGIQAVIDEQRLSVPLPGCAADLQFSRKSKIYASVAAAKADSNIMVFVRKLQASARKQGVLTAPPELLVKLPLCIVEPTGSENAVEGDTLSRKYMFERFEHIQRLELAPIRNEGRNQDMNADAKSTLDSLPARLRLDYREVEGGAIYGNSTILSLNIGREPKTKESAESRVKNEPPEDEDVMEQQLEQTCSDSSSLDLANAAVRIAHLLTRSYSGGLQGFDEKAKE